MSTRSAKLVKCLDGGTSGLTDVDHAGSEFGCSAVLAVPIWEGGISGGDPGGQQLCGVLFLGLALGASEEQG